MNKKEVLKILKEAKKIVVTIEDWEYSIEYRSYFPHMMVWALNPDFTFHKVIYENSPYWNGVSRAYEVDAWGVDRAMDVVESIVGSKELCNLENKIIKLY